MNETQPQVIHQYDDLYLNSNANTVQPSQEHSVDIKIKIAIGFGVGCAVLLIIVFGVLLYKILRLRAQNRKEALPGRQIVHRTPSIHESCFSHAPQRRRHRPLMKTDSSASDIDIQEWRDTNQLSPSSDSENGAILDPIFKHGKLEFSINYDTTHECLRITVISAHDLPLAEPTTYVEVYLLPDKAEKQQTKIHYKHANPVYEEGFEFDVAFAELPERTLHFCIYTYDGYSRHQAIGEVFHTFDVNVNMEEDQTVVHVKDITKDAFLFRDENPVRTGEVLVSLCYLPTSGRLTFVVLKARLSKKEMGSVLPNPFVKVSLMLSGRQIKKTKTSIVRKTLQPVYNEAFVFDIPIRRLSDVSLLVRVLSSHPEGGGDRDGRIIGKAIVGPDARTSIGLHHWNCMMTSPRKPIAQWHPLLHM